MLAAGDAAIIKDNEAGTVCQSEAHTHQHAHIQMHMHTLLLAHTRAGTHTYTHIYKPRKCLSIKHCWWALSSDDNRDDNRDDNASLSSPEDLFPPSGQPNLLLLTLIDLTELFYGLYGCSHLFQLWSSDNPHSLNSFLPLYKYCVYDCICPSRGESHHWQMPDLFCSEWLWSSGLIHFITN